MPESRRNRGGAYIITQPGTGTRKMPQPDTLTAPGAAGAGSLGRNASDRPARVLLSSGIPRRGFPSLLRFRLEEAVRSDEHALAACTALAVVTAGIPAAHDGGQQTELDAGIVRQLHPALGNGPPGRVSAASGPFSQVVAGGVWQVLCLGSGHPGQGVSRHRGQRDRRGARDWGR